MMLCLRHRSGLRRSTGLFKKLQTPHLIGEFGSSRMFR